MKKKTLLATLVMISLLQGNVYAGKIAPGTYEDEYKYTHPSNNSGITIDAAGDYDFKGGLTVDRVASESKETAIIGIADSANNADKELNITIGDINIGEKVKLNLKTQTESNYIENSLIQVGGIGNFKNKINIQLENADMILNGEKYFGALVADNFYSNESSNGELIIKGDGNSNIYILGDMSRGIYTTGNTKLNIEKINDLVIKRNNAFDGADIRSEDETAISSISDVKSTISVNNLVIDGEDLEENQNAFYRGVYVGRNSLKPVSPNFELLVNENINIDSVVYGIVNEGDAKVKANNIFITAQKDVVDTDSWGSPEDGGGIAVDTAGVLDLNAENSIILYGQENALNIGSVSLTTNVETEFTKKFGNTYIKAENGKIVLYGEEGVGLISETQLNQKEIKTAIIEAEKDIKIYGAEKGIWYNPGSRNLSVISENGNIEVESLNTAFDATVSGKKTISNENTRGIVNINAVNGSVSLSGLQNGLLIDNAINNKKSGLKLKDTSYFTTANLQAQNNIFIEGLEEYGMKVSNKLSDEDLDVVVPSDMDKNTNLNVTSQGTINVLGGKAGIMATAVKEEFNSEVFNELTSTDFGSKVDLNAADDVVVQGGDYGVIAFENSNVDITSANGNVLIGATDTNTEKASNTAAVYAENGANTQTTVNIKADNGVVNVLSGNKGLWASGKGGTINVDGAVNINANYFADESATRSAGEDVHLAVVAGLKSAEEEQNGEGLVDINLKGDVTSSIYGDIVGARGGKVDITRESGNGALVVNGDVLAGNGGTVSLDMGKNGVLTGRIDDYMDADKKNGNSFFAPQFSYEIEDSGKVDLKLGDGSRWNVDGQSWVTTINAGKNTVIDLTGAATDRNTTAHALTIGTLNGDANFRMNLDGFDKANSDMLYIKNSNGEYNVILDDAVTSEEIGETGLRFATIDNGNVNFKNVVVYNAGAFDVKYKVGKDAYEGHLENDDYNGGTEFGEVKPGTEAVDDFFKEEESTIDMLNDGESTLTNYKIVDVHSRELNNTGKTIVGMSRANYSNAIYMDRLNKRLGEARYINGEEDQGMWVRIRHDRIGKDNAFRSQNTMYELGYDEKQECDNGERRVGFAVDYMHGDTSYSNIGGKGEIDRYGLWLYDTWMGDKGHYADYVAKWGHLKNDFGIYAAGVKDKITGDYSNNVFSISAEYGRKKDIGNDWYIEPQAQLQLARVTGADYVTNQNTKVSVDGINSLIGRAGFRIGKDFGEEKQSTLYFKADILHEFLGDQDISLKDKTSDSNWETVSYDNQGTWYDIGLGFATMMSKNSYAFVDLEKSFGNDNDETYQINAGVQWTF